MPLIANKYDVIDILGQGHFGTVYRVKDLIVNAEKALKAVQFSTQQELQAALAEAVSMQSCNHPNILKINGAQLAAVGSSNCLLIDMEFISGGSLQSRMTNEFISPVKLRNWAIDGLFGLHHIHSCGLLHRDIKPANILLKNNIPVISDLGLCAAMNSGNLGPPGGYTTHLPPEYFTNQTTSVLTDVYAFGITLFRVANNYSDWSNRIALFSNLQTLVRNGKLIQSVGYQKYVPTKLMRIINKACHALPTNRFSSAQKLREALERLSPRIDWTRNGGQWNGCDISNGSQYLMSLISARRHRIDFFENGRRKKAFCSSFDNIGDAHDYAYQIIKDRSFA